MSDIAWAAGLFEGEGCFTLAKSPKSRHRRGTSVVALAMTDEDIVRRFHSVVGIGKITVSPRPPNKTQYKWYVYGDNKLKYIVELFRPWLSERRLDRATEILERKADT